MDDSLIDFLLLVISNSEKCQHCVKCFQGGGCIEAYSCIGHNFDKYEKEEV